MEMGKCTNETKFLKWSRLDHMNVMYVSLILLHWARGFSSNDRKVIKVREFLNKSDARLQMLQSHTIHKVVTVGKNNAN